MYGLGNESFLRRDASENVELRRMKSMGTKHMTSMVIDNKFYYLPTDTVSFINFDGMM